LHQPTIGVGGVMTGMRLRQQCQAEMLGGDHFADRSDEVTIGA
jgi:hypothetical protein